MTEPARCVYCGARLRAGSTVCAAHADLGSADPNLREQLARATVTRLEPPPPHPAEQPSAA